jgi:hypothetical protein
MFLRSLAYPLFQLPLILPMEQFVHEVCGYRFILLVIKLVSFRDSNLSRHFSFTYDAATTYFLFWSPFRNKLKKKLLQQSSITGSCLGVEIDLNDKYNQSYSVSATERANTNMETYRPNMLHLKHFNTQTAFFSP